MTEKPGPTGLHPDGRLRTDDEGELNIGITHDDGKVVMAFGTPVKWIGMEPDDARAIARILLERADRAEGQIVRERGH